MRRYLSARKLFLQCRCPYCGSPPPAFGTRRDGEKKLFSCGSCTHEFASPYAWFACTHAERYRDESPKPRWPYWKTCFECVNTGEVIVFDRLISLDRVPFKVGEVAGYCVVGQPDEHGISPCSPGRAKVVEAHYEPQGKSSEYYHWVYKLEGIDQLYSESCLTHPDHDVPVYKECYENEKELLASYPFPILVRHTEAEWQAIKDAEREADYAKRPEFHKAMDHYCGVLLPQVEAMLRKGIK